MTAQTLPDEPDFCFAPAWDVETEVQQIHIVIEGLAGHVPTALVTLDIEDAMNICDKLNRRLGYDREAWTAMVAESMRAETPEPGDPPRTDPHPGSSAPCNCLNYRYVFGQERVTPCLPRKPFEPPYGSCLGADPSPVPAS